MCMEPARTRISQVHLPEMRGGQMPVPPLDVFFTMDAIGLEVYFLPVDST